MVTIEASSTTISWATTTMTRIGQRLGSGPAHLGYGHDRRLGADRPAAAPSQRSFLGVPSPSSVHPRGWRRPSSNLVEKDRGSRLSVT